MIARRPFRAMGTAMELLVDADAPEPQFDAAEAEIRRLEAIMTRFDPASELSRLNRDGVIDANRRPPASGTGAGYRLDQGSVGGFRGSRPAGSHPAPP